MVAAVVAAPLDHRRPAELAAPDDQRVVEHPALLEVLDQRGAGLVGVLAVLLEVVRRGCRAGPTTSWKISTKRTPRSSSRRASRQVLANDGLPGSAP